MQLRGHADMFGDRLLHRQNPLIARKVDATSDTQSPPQVVAKKLCHRASTNQIK